MLAEIGTGWPGSRIGSTERVELRVPHHVEGSADGTSGRPSTSSAASAARRRAAASRSGAGGRRVGSGAAQLGDQAAEGQRPRRAAVLVLDRDAQLLEEARGLLAVVVGRAHRAHDQPAAGPGARDVEQPALLHEQRARGHGRDEVGTTRGVDPDPVGAEQRGAAAQVGPALLLHVGDHDEVPLEALGAVGGEEPDRRAAHPSLGQRVGGQLLGDEAGEEGADTDVVALVDRARGQLEERHDRVEVAVRPTGRGAAEVDLPAQPLGPGRCRTTGATGRPPRRHARRASARPRAAGRRGRPARSTSGPSRSSRKPGATTARRSSSRDVRRESGVGPAFSRVRRRRTRARRSEASRPPSGESSSDSMRPGSRKSGESGSSLSRLTTARSASRSGSTAGSCTSGRSSEATSTGTPAAASARRSGGMLVRPERTSTAIRSQAMPSSRWARRSRSASRSASARSVS